GPAAQDTPKTDRPSPAKAATTPAAPGLPLTGGGMTVKPRPGGTDNVQGTPHDLATAKVEAAKTAKVDRARHEIGRSAERLKEWVKRGYDEGVVAINIETLGIDPIQAPLCGIALAVAPNEACYVPLAHRKAGNGDGLFGGGLDADQISEKAALAALKPL